IAPPKTQSAAASSNWLSTLPITRNDCFSVPIGSRPSSASPTSAQISRLTVPAILPTRPTRRSLPTTSSVGGCASMASLRIPSISLCQICEHFQSEPRLRVMIASKAGAASANGRGRPCRRFFRCADTMEGGEAAGETKTRTSLDNQPIRYYESLDLIDALHPQTILAYEMNGQPLPVAHGAPLRLRVERQLGYKMAKYLMRIELVDSYAAIGGGRGGYWEDRGYDWYAGI